jgi:hypothetical protein
MKKKNTIFLRFTSRNFINFLIQTITPIYVKFLIVLVFINLCFYNLIARTLPRLQNSKFQSLFTVGFALLAEL